MALSLKARKNIRDATPKMEEALQVVEKALGAKFTFEVDFASLIASKPDMSENQIDDIGNIIYGSYFSSFAQGLKEFVQRSPLYKEAVLELATTKRITFEIVKDEKTWKATAGKRSPSYCARVSVVDGVIVLEARYDKFCYNVDGVRQELVHTFAGTGVSLKCRQNIADFAPKMEEILSETETTSGIRFDVEVDYNGLMSSIVRRDLDDALGEFVYNYVRSVCNTINKQCKTDDLNKEAVQELCVTKKLKFHVYKDRKEYDKVKAGTNNCGRGRIVNGDFVVELHNESFYVNVDTFFDFNKTFSGA